MLAYIHRCLSLSFSGKLVKIQNGDILLKMPFVNASIDPVSPDAIPQNDLTKLKTAATQHQQQKQSHTCIHLITSPTNQNEVIVRVHGFLWENIPEFDTSKLRLRISVWLHSSNLSAIGEFMFIDTDFKSNLSPNRRNLDVNQESCIGADESFSEILQGGPLYSFFNYVLSGGYHIQSYSQILLYHESLINLMSPPSLLAIQEKFAINRKMLTEKVLSDVIIVSANSHEFPCHTAFLSAHSPVFAAMFENDMKESKTRKVELPGMSQRGVKAFLAFLYFWDEEEPQKHSALVLELLEAGHKYEITSLQDRMRDIIVGKPNDWFDEEVALRLFFFTRNVEGCNDVKLKAVKIIKSQSKKILKSECYNKLFDENPAAACKAVMELCLHAFDQ